MRLSESQINVIKTTVHALDPKARIYLFGSRADDSKRGGDIDLLIMSQELTKRDARPIRLGLYKQLGEQKIDIVIARNTDDAFVRIALVEGVAL
ncbi:MAG TPA: nucleotidyltransferase domain-containing protein [Chloroflexi bacterium]|nr:MAG: DNA polymerase III subunit beta [Anaerolineaceae bacterium 4572_5.2]HEY85149.1 nucleotidyltransferase domain-containing protein [Chloroflexota bacterium]